MRDLRTSLNRRIRVVVPEAVRDCSIPISESFYLELPESEIGQAPMHEDNRFARSLINVFQTG